VTVRVEPMVSEAYDAEFRMNVDDARRHTLQPGSTLPILVSRTDPSRVALDRDRYDRETRPIG